MSTLLTKLLADALEDFEVAAAEGKRALDVRGEDVAAYCDAHLGDVRPMQRYLDKWRNSLNHDVRKQL